MTLIEGLIVAFIVVGIGVAIWRGGAANPVGTGTLEHNMRGLRQEFKAIERLAGGAAQASDVESLREEMERNQTERGEAMKQLGADVAKIGSEVDALQKDVAGRLARVETTTQATSRSVDRIERLLIEDGLRGRKS